MAKHRKKIKWNIPMCLAGVLFCLTLLSIRLTSGLYARYTASGKTDDAARVITFGDLEVTETGDFEENGTMLIIPGVDLTKKAVVNFAGSEAAVYVFVEADVSADWKTVDGKTFSVSNGSKELMRWMIGEEWRFLEEEQGAYIYYRVLEPNTPLDTDIIADGTVYVSDQLTKSELEGMDDVSIQFRAAAVQLGGFDGPTAAWASLAAKEG